MNPRIAFIAAPLLAAAYGVIRIFDGIDGSREPGLAWTGGHLAFLVALVLFVVTLWEMRRMAGRNALSTASTAVGVLGAVSLAAQFVIDIVVGLMSVDRAGMEVLFEQVQSIPGVSLAVYGGGPFLFYIGMLALLIQLAVQRRVKAWTPVLALVYLLAPAISLDLIPVGALALLVVFVSVAKTPRLVLVGAGARQTIHLSR